jgi:hypothetical protein
LTTNNPIFQNNNVSVFPNPTTGIVNIELKNLNIQASSNHSFVMFDATGKKVFENKYFSKSSLLFHVGDLQNGMYYWLLTTENTSYNGKLILTK